jgi:hypothetical protein
VLAPVLGLLIVLGYGLALWWLLRREALHTFVILTALCGASLALRVVLTGGYPWGLFEDEPKFLACSLQALQGNNLFSESCIHIPYLLTVLFEAQLVPWLGPTRWAIRSYSLITGVLATPAVFAAARSMRLRVAPALLVAGLITVLPWSIFYGRIALGGELIFHQALLLAGLARLIWMAGGAPDALLGGFGLCLLLYDYWAGRAMMSMPLVAAVLASGWRRVWCLAVIAIALIGWIPHLATGPLDAHVGLSLQPARGAPVAGAFHSDLQSAPLDFFIARGGTLLRTLQEPVGYEAVFTMRSDAMHPPALLILAALGLLTGMRRGLFLLAGFAAGVLPSMLSSSFAISAHRMMMAYTFIALAAGSAVTIVPWRWPRRAAAAVILALAAGWSVPLYFSDRFWPADWRWNDNAEVTALAEALADDPPQRVIHMRHLGFWATLASIKDAALLGAQNWLPPNNLPVTYAFTSNAKLLRPQYEQFLPGRVRPVGRDSFLVRFEANDWSWLRKYGWAYKARCGDKVESAQVPFLYFAHIGPEGFPCADSIAHEWRARWHGPDTEMTLYFSGAASVKIGDQLLQQEGFEQTMPLHIPADSDLTVILVSPPVSSPVALLRELAPGGIRVPNWELFTPPS